MYKIKQLPQDFIVKEIPNYKLEESGPYSYFWLTKKDHTTMYAVKKIADKLNIPLKHVGFAGTKDKRAVTKQAISIKNIKKDKINNLNLNNIKLEYIGKGSSPISLGDLKENEFVITVRNIDTKKIRHRDIVPNFFGPQRFSKNNIEIGRALVKRDFKKAVSLIDQIKVQKHLEKFTEDYIGALRKLPLKIRKIYIHAYQSDLWNKTAKSYIKAGHHKNIKIPIIGFGTEINNIKNNDLKDIITDILKKEEISVRDFIFPAIKEISAEGDKRDLFVIPKNLDIDLQEDDINKDKLKVIVSFSLPKSSYATVVIKYLFKKKITE